MLPFETPTECKNAVVTKSVDFGAFGIAAAILGAAAGERVVERIWARDGTLWAPAGTPEVADRLGWLDIAERMRDRVDDFDAFAAEVREAHDYGVEVAAGVRVNFPAVMERMRRLRAALSPNDSAARSVRA